MTRVLKDIYWINIMYMFCDNIIQVAIEYEKLKGRKRRVISNFNIYEKTY